MDIHNLIGTRVVLKTTLSSDDILNKMQGRDGKINVFFDDATSVMFKTKVKNNTFSFYQTFENMYIQNISPTTITGKVLACNNCTKVRLYIHYDWIPLLVFLAFFVYLLSSIIWVFMNKGILGALDWFVSKEPYFLIFMLVFFGGFYLFHKISIKVALKALNILLDIKPECIEQKQSSFDISDYFFKQASFKTNLSADKALKKLEGISNSLDLISFDGSKDSFYVYSRDNKVWLQKKQGYFKRTFVPLIIADTQECADGSLVNLRLRFSHNELYLIIFNLSVVIFAAIYFLFFETTRHIYWQWLLTTIGVVYFSIHFLLYFYFMHKNYKRCCKAMFEGIPNLFK